MDRLQKSFDLIDAANSEDPSLENGTPAALLYGLRMTDELNRLFPDADDVLRIAARGQHIERWLLPRSDYPEGKTGYFEWRREQARRHAARVAGIMAQSGYSQEDQDRIGVLLRKEGIKRDDQVQALEDVICFTFIRWYFADFANGRDAAEVVDIVHKTARKMSAEGRAGVLQEFALPDDLKEAVQSVQGK